MNLESKIYMLNNLFIIFCIFEILNMSTSYAMKGTTGQVANESPVTSEQFHRYEPQRLSFSVVSEGNCQRLSSGKLSGCEFPRIKITEAYPKLPPLPFATAVNVHTSRSCDLNGPE